MGHACREIAFPSGLLPVFQVKPRNDVNKVWVPLQCDLLSVYFSSFFQVFPFLSPEKKKSNFPSLFPNAPLFWKNSDLVYQIMTSESSVLNWNESQNRLHIISK